MSEKQAWKWKADAEYRFFLYVPEGGGMMFYHDKAVRDNDAEKAIAERLDEGMWPEWVENICVGEVTALSDCPNKEMRPEITEDMDADEIEEIQSERGETEWRGNYVLVELK